ncbi:MAG TPA: cobalt-precorrin 5A hydrolase [Methanomassiliicoccales archaeon]|jgi:cobalt-precorrin 5A hydrolase
MSEAQVIGFAGDEDAALVAEHLGAELVLYDDRAFENAFREGKHIVAVMAMGIVVRKIAPLLRDKWTDPAVVVVPSGLRYAIPLVGGHHGANELAKRLAGIGAEPVITTATEANGKASVEMIMEEHGLTIMNPKSTVAVNRGFLEGDVPVHAIEGPAVVIAGPKVSILFRKGSHIVGLGCNTGTTKEEIVDLVNRTLKDVGIGADDVLAYSTTVKKRREKGLIEAVYELGGDLVFVDDETINSNQGVTPSKAGLIGLVGVAEPSALALSKHHELVMERRAEGNVTIAIAK